MGDTDITLAIRVDDITLLEQAFKAVKPMSQASGIAMSIDNPESVFDFDAENKRTVLRAVVTIRLEAGENAGKPDSDPALVFGTTLGVVTSVAAMESTAGAARPMAGGDDPEARRDDKMSRSLLLEAIKAAHGFASAKLAELSSLSPTPKILLPAIDADTLLIDLERRQSVGKN
ncbi:hypothetical protein [Paratractidigestivibacter sp.]|uniref:hypothetical protein n=1 Tax=Paratractidigestivibacter sp. TaxID=2847316 RepID=UPI002AC96ECA|nr:hypothetical protein [Paratractidigestivibacter sp.]